MKTLSKLSPLLLFFFLFQYCGKKERSTADLSAPVKSTATNEKSCSPDQSSSPSSVKTLSEKKNSGKKNKKGGITSFTMLYDRLQNTAQQFELDPSRDTVFTCAQGTRVEIKANSFLLKNELCLEPVSLFIKECYRPEDMVFADLSTTSNHRLLESGGMIHLEAFSENQLLTLDPKKTIALKMPTEGAQQYMQLFYAGKEPNGTLNWLQANDSKPQFAQVSKPKKNNVLQIRSGNYAFMEGGIATVVVTVSILQDGVERTLSTTSYANRTLCQGTDNLSMQFDIDGNGIIQNAALSDSIVNKRYTISVHRLESINANKMIFYPYTPGNLRFMDCALIFNTTLQGKGFTPSFIVPRMDYSTIKKRAGKNEKVRVIVRNQYAFISTGGQNRANELKQKLDSAGNNLKNISSEELEYYVFNVNQMGWINCDRFYNVPAAQKIDFTVSDAKGEDVKLVFSDLRSVMRGARVGHTISFKNIPENKEVTLIGIRIVNEKAELAILKTTTKRISEDKLVYLPVTVDELKDKIKTML